jgi:hypothetical protein
LTVSFIVVAPLAAASIRLSAEEVDAATSDAT